MAYTAEQLSTISRLRALTGETVVDETIDSSPYTDEDLLNRVTEAGNLTAAAGQIWLEKSARYADLVNISDASGSRSLGQLQEHALTMARVFGVSTDTTTTTTTTRRGTTTRAITREVGSAVS